ncbi:hypothetical protein LTR91_023199 [Friedmanniomyces endolithicus]|uniref:Uncharacterized protein n=1 Tax=Friedmanniomyces endolithicus TaxID=329885 RepID=A0AAN6H3I4_9PEZI|nr:hypothetical protein LTR59_016841 [Friedmanniomyces endolithicus]KAK0817904.1 hypothetical protein LTR75_002833 [Friedmanniomyces endolithicus]KAK0838038.1 hypothetical protein LTS02_017849 [Friedmanniomyces endolithicus]KAK0891058.1 hypothetical protein LTR57_024917 [Friedmanniomyces endolithicus]KAK0954620.1 hypothetical protein LTS01_023816 [Friedmanniomyces endolithicus]
MSLMKISRVEKTSGTTRTNRPNHCTLSILLFLEPFKTSREVWDYLTSKYASTSDNFTFESSPFGGVSAPFPPVTAPASSGDEVQAEETVTIPQQEQKLQEVQDEEPVAVPKQGTDTERDNADGMDLENEIPELASIGTVKRSRGTAPTRTSTRSTTKSAVQLRSEKYLAAEDSHVAAAIDPLPLKTALSLKTFYALTAAVDIY